MAGSGIKYIDMIAIIISSAALIVSVLAYVKAHRKANATLKYVYTEDGLVFYDETGKEIVIEGSK